MDGNLLLLFPQQMANHVVSGALLMTVRIDGAESGQAGPVDVLVSAGGRQVPRK
jgi:hypothetical protein